MSLNQLKGPKIFLIDAVGAAISVGFLYVLYTFPEFFGMPKSVIRIFMLIAAVFFIYSGTVYFIRPSNWKVYLKAIAILNLGYCLFTLYHVFLNRAVLTGYGYTYFTMEILVIFILARFELRLASN